MPSNANLKVRLLAASILGGLALLALAARPGRAQTTDCSARPEMVELVQHYHDINASKPSYSGNWLRVLKSFGATEANVKPYSAAAAGRSMAVWHGWRPVRDELQRIEDCKAEQQAAVQEDTVETVVWNPPAFQYSASTQDSQITPPTVSGFTFIEDRSRSWVDILRYGSADWKEMLLMRRPGDTRWTRTTCLGDLAAFDRDLPDYRFNTCRIWAQNFTDDNYTPSGARCRWMPAGATFRLFFRFAGDILWLEVACP